MNDQLTIEHRDLNPLILVEWFAKNTELRSVSPYVATESDAWVVVKNEDIHAMALVENAEVHRIGVAPDHRRQGIGSTLIDRLLAEYGELELVCRKSLPANKFYATTGWEQTGVRWGDPEDLIEWRLSDDE